MPKKTFVIIQQYSHAEPIVVFREVHGTKMKAKSVEELDHDWCATFEIPISDNKTKIETLFFIKDEADGNDTWLQVETRNNKTNEYKRYKDLHLEDGEFNVKSYDLR